jgi:hypothetical protein
MEIRTMEEAATLYRKVEAKIEAKQTEFDASVAKERRALEQLEVIMTAMLNQAGVESMNIPGVGEAVLTTKRTYGCGDWDLLYTWIVVNNKPELLHKRIHEGNMQYWIDEQNKRVVAGEIPATEAMPPAVNVFSKNVFKLLKGK